MLHLLLVLSGAIPRRERTERGATAVEYALIAGLCVLAFVAGIAALRLMLGGVFGATQTSLNDDIP